MESTRFDIIDVQTLTDGQNKTYCSYFIQVQTESLSWMISKRFSDFDHLRSILLTQPADETDYIPARYIPELPSKMIFGGGYMADGIIADRKVKLKEFMEALLNYHDKVMPNHHSKMLQGFELFSQCSLLTHAFYIISFGIPWGSKYQLE